MTQDNEELYQFLVCDYYATGEGRTVCLLITRAYPHVDDYEKPGKFEDGVYTPPVLKKGMTDKVRAAREFADKFGGYYLQGAENLPRQDFLAKYGHLLPEFAHKLLAEEGDNRPGNFNFAQQFHMNFS